MTSSIDELCRMLDERVVKYTKTVVTEGVLFTVVTSEEHYFILVRDNDAGIEMWSQYLTPEQAIAAMLGAGTCHLIDTQFPTGDDSYFKACSGCGFWIYNRYNWENTRFCPHCGRKVVDA